MSDIRIGLLWHSAMSGNLGVGALTVGNMIAAKAAAEAEGLSPKFTILGFASDFDKADLAGEGIDSFDITTRSLLSPSGYWAELGKLDCVLDIGLGDSFADIYGAKRFGFMHLTKEMALMRGVPLLFSPQTIGPFSRQPYKLLAARTMTRAKAVVARDPQSLDAARRLAPRARLVRSVDVAFRLPFEAPPPPGPKAKVGVNVSGLLFNGGYSGGNAFGLDIAYPDLMRRFIAALQARDDVETHLICHVNSERLPADDDGRVADLLAKEFPAVVRAPDFPTPSAAKSYIAALQFLVAGRMHACIGAFSAGVPVAPIAYSRKFAGLFEGVLGYPYQVPVKGMSTDQALAYLLDCFERRDELASAVAEGNIRVAAALDAYHDELRGFFREAAARR